MTQERKDYKETQQGVTKKQRNTTHHRGAYINTPRSGDGIANMSAVHYSNPQQVIIDSQLKNSHQYFTEGFSRNSLLFLYWNNLFST